MWAYGRSCLLEHSGFLGHFEFLVCYVWLATLISSVVL